ncbi:MAG: tetratricopeptide repeat protein [Candidatus Omnitrophota bacterium]
MKIDNIFKKIDFVFAFICLFLIFFLLIIYSNGEITKLDTWLHLKTGEWILANKAIPHYDIYSYIYSGNKWIDHEWLFQVISFSFYNKLGVSGLLFMQTIVAFAVFLIFIFIGYRLKEYVITLIPLLLCLYIFRSRFARPEIFSVLFLSVYLLIINRYLNSKWYLFLLIPIQIIWTNMHGFFFVGPLLILFLIISDFVKSKVRLPWQWNEANRLNDPARIKLICVFLYLILACLVNPYFWEGALYPLKVFFSLGGESRLLFKNIVELLPPITGRQTISSVLMSDYLTQYIVLIIISLLSFKLNYKRANIFNIIIWVFFFILASVSVRNVAFFCFIAYFVYTENMRGVVSLKFKTKLFPDEKIQYLLKWILSVFIMMFVMQNAKEFMNRKYYVFDESSFKSSIGGFSKSMYPEKAVDFILANNIKGNIYNEFNSGAYLIGRCYPQVKVFIDGRTELYGIDFFKKYDAIVHGDTKLLEEQIKKYDIKSALLNSVLFEIPREVSTYFYKDPDWKLVFFDEFSLIFLKDVKENKAIIKKFKIDLGNWKPPEPDLKKIGFAAVSPYTYVNRAYTLYGLGMYKQAILEAKEAIRINPNSSNAYKLLGIVYYNQKLYDKAFESYRLAGILNPSDPKIRVGSGLVLSALGDLEGAIEEMETAIKISPHHADAYYRLSLLLKKTGENKKAIESLKKAVKLSPKYIEYLLELGTAHYDEKDFKSALDLYKRALEIRSDSAKIRTSLGVALSSLGQNDEAEEEFKKAIEINDKYAEAYLNLGVFYGKTKRYDEARDIWKKGLRIDPKNKDIRDNLKKLKKVKSKGKNQS